MNNLLRANRKSPNLKYYYEQARNNPNGDFILFKGRLLLKGRRLVIPDEG